MLPQNGPTGVGATNPSWVAETLFHRLLGKFSPILIREVVQAVQGFKVACVDLSDDEIDFFSAAATELRFGIAVADLKNFGRPDIGKGGWSNRLCDSRADQAGLGSTSTYIAKTMASSEEACALDNSEDVNRFGELLGFPECCRAFYRKNWETAQCLQGDFALLTADATPVFPYNGWTNYLAQYFQYSLISHFPCSFTCEHTARLGAQAHEFLQRLSPEFAASFLLLHRSAIVYTEFQGLCLLPGARWKENSIWYDSVRSTIPGQLDEAVRRGNRIQVTGKHSFEVHQGSELVLRMDDPTVCALPFV